MADIIVNVDQGALRGQICSDYENGKYYSFYGIPYAKPPVGELRFKSPKPPNKWEGVRDATIEKDGCVSRHTITLQLQGTEDCLFLNVYTPQLPKKGEALKPVMVWIHGGAFTTGSSKTELFGPDFLITEDVVVVTVSYRLGVLGFLCLDDPSLEVPGNAALRDVLMAFKWIKKNIENFNGDPNNITAVGQSSGAATIHYLMLSPLGKGLFHKVILQSASALNIWTTGTRKSGEILAEILGIETKDEKEILKIFQSLPAETLVKARDKMKNPYFPNVTRHFSPVIEKENQLEEPIILQPFVDIIRKGNYNKVPMITGYTSQEGLFFDPIISKRKPTELLVDNFEKMIPYGLNIEAGTDVSKHIAEQIKEFYYGDIPPTNQHKENYFRMKSDIYFVHGVHSTVRHHLENSGYPIYLYKFTIDEKLNIYKKAIRCTEPGASHADDVCYIFKMALTPKIDVGSVEYKTVKRMVKFWTTFVKYGDPNPKERDPLIDVQWKPVEKDALHYLNIGEDLSTGINPDVERMEFCNKIFNGDPVLAKL